MNLADFERAKKIQQEIAAVERAIKDVEVDINIHKLSEDVFLRHQKEKVDDLRRHIADLNTEFSVL